MRDDVTSFWSSSRACARQGSVRHMRATATHLLRNEEGIEGIIHMTARQATNLGNASLTWG